MKDTSSQQSSYEDNKKNDGSELDPAPQPQGGIFWRLGSGLYSTTTGAASMGYGAVKYCAQTSYGVVSKTAEIGVSATKAVAGKLPAPPIPSFSKQKDKKE